MGELLRVNKTVITESLFLPQNAFRPPQCQQLMQAGGNEKLLPKFEAPAGGTSIGAEIIAR